MTFYHKTAVKTVSPLVVIALLGCYPLSERLRGKSINAATITVKRLALLLIEVALPSIATSLVQV